MGVVRCAGSADLAFSSPCAAPVLSAIVWRASALGRNDPTLLSRNCHHHAEAVVVLPAGKSGFLPQANVVRGKAPAPPFLAASPVRVAWSQKLSALRAASARTTENHRECLPRDWAHVGVGAEGRAGTV